MKHPFDSFDYYLSSLKHPTFDKTSHALVNSRSFINFQWLCPDVGDKCSVSRFEDSFSSKFCSVVRKWIRKVLVYFSVRTEQQL